MTYEGWYAIKPKQPTNNALDCLRGNLTQKISLRKNKVHLDYSDIHLYTYIVYIIKKHE